MRRLWILILIAPVAGAGVPGFDERLDGLERRLALIEIISADGGRLDWSAAHGKIAFDRMRDNGYFGLYTMQADESGRTCLSCSYTRFHRRHLGQPSWHPSGEWIVFQAEKGMHPDPSVPSRPGFGRNNDLWIIDKDGDRMHRIHRPPEEI